MQNLKPAAAISMLRLIARQDWREFEPADTHTFADAGPDARIAEVGPGDTAIIAQLFDTPLDPTMGMMAVLGGESLQLELHGMNRDGSPAAIGYNLHASDLI